MNHEEMYWEYNVFLPGALGKGEEGEETPGAEQEGEQEDSE